MNNFFVMSDIHIDFYLDLWKNNKEWGTQDTKIYENCIPSFEKFYELYMQPADVLIFPGDCANDYYAQINFYKFLGTKYNDVYVVFGNHDLCIKATFGNGNPFKYTEQRCNAVKDMFKTDPHIHILDGELIDDIGGTMGMCDFHYSTNFDMGIPYKIKQWQTHWFDGKNWHIKTPEWHNGFRINPIAIWVNEKQKMLNIIKHQPKIMITHFCPMELGVQREYENSSSTSYFYFEGKELLDMFEHEAWWFCGHIHAIGQCDYVNAKGNIIHIWALPNGYPGENPYTEGTFKTMYDKTLNRYSGISGMFYDKSNRMFKI